MSLVESRVEETLRLKFWSSACSWEETVCFYETHSWSQDQKGPFISDRLVTYHHRSNSAIANHYTQILGIELQPHRSSAARISLAELAGSNRLIKCPPSLVLVDDTLIDPEIAFAGGQKDSTNCSPIVELSM